MKKKKGSNIMEEKRKITYNSYEIGKLTAVVCAIYKTENAPDLNRTLLKLMQTDIENTKNDD